VVNCTTTEIYSGAHAFAGDGTLAILDSDHTGVTWRRAAPPWSAAATDVRRMADANQADGGRPLPRIAASPDGTRLLVRGAIGRLDARIYDLDATGAGPQLVPVGATVSDTLDFAVTFADTTPYLLLRDSNTSHDLSLTFFKGPASVGGSWTPLGSWTTPGTAATALSDGAVQGQLLTLAREATGDLIGFDVDAGLAVLAMATGTITRPTLDLPHAVRAASATLSPAGQAVLFLLSEDPEAGTVLPDAGGMGPRWYVERATHEQGGWSVATVASGWWSIDSLDRVNSQVAAVDDTHAIAFLSTLSDAGAFTLFEIAQAPDGSWSSTLVCTSARCDNAGWQRGYTRLAVAPGATVATNGGFPPNTNTAGFGGTITVLHGGGASWTAAQVGPEGERIVNPCETIACDLRGAAARDGRGAAWTWLLALAPLLLVGRRRRH
jgi:hypothetical protein